MVLKPRATKGGTATKSAAKPAAKSGSSKSESKTAAKPAGKAAENGAGGAVRGKADMKEFGKNWNAGRKAASVKGGDFEVPDIDDGTYVARVTVARTNLVDKDGKIVTDSGKNPYVSVGFTVVRGDYKGTNVSFMSGLGSDKQCKMVAENLGRLLNMSDEEVQAIDPPDLITIVNDLNEENPKRLAQIRVKNGEYQGKAQVSVFVGKVLEDEDD